MEFCVRLSSRWLRKDDTRSLSVNRSGRINIWTAILGYLFIPLPAFFDVFHNLRSIVTENFPGKGLITAFLFCFFTRLSV
ncbi:DUF2684 family protein [Kosakonia sp. CCTCC M2018092]|nr:DUF2684 family protein [Kosakonia sp. CCTCC M2018092]